MHNKYQRIVTALHAWIADGNDPMQLTNNTTFEHAGKIIQLGSEIHDLLLANNGNLATFKQPIRDYGITTFGIQTATKHERDKQNNTAKRPLQNYTSNPDNEPTGWDRPEFAYLRPCTKTIEPHRVRNGRDSSTTPHHRITTR